MTRIKLCGLSRKSDILAANRLQPEYIGFVFAQKSRRYVSPEKAAELKKLLAKDILAVGVFVNEQPGVIADLLNEKIIDIAQLHGDEDEAYMEKLKDMTGRPLIRAFCVKDAEDIQAADRCPADYVLLDSGTGSGQAFDWQLTAQMKRPYFLAGGLSPDNVSEAVAALHPFAVDVSSGIETDGAKDEMKMAAFVRAVREEDRQ